MMRISCLKLPSLDQSNYYSRSLLSTNRSEHQLQQSEECSICTDSIAMCSDSMTHDSVDHQNCSSFDQSVAKLVGGDITM